MREFMHDWKEILDTNSLNVWKTVCRLVDDHHDAQDCFQDVFKTAFEISCRQNVQNMGGLLQHIAVRKSIDRLRKLSANRQTRSGLEDDFACGRCADPAGDCEKSELAARLTEALASIPPLESELFCLFHISDVPYSKIAEITGIKKNAVGVYLQRAREKLGRKLKDYAFER